MKNSGIEWIGEIPDGWEMIPNKHLFLDHSQKVGKKWTNYKLLSLTTSGVKEKDINSTGGKIPDSYENYQTVVPGDMVFCLFDLDCSAVFSGLSAHSGMITSAYDVFAVNDNLIDEKYIDYWFQYVFSNRYYKMYSKNIRYTVTGETFGATLTPVPPIKTQRKIGVFLKNKCAEVDKLIEVQQAQIDKLKEYKQSVITEAVTKGLDPTVPMKDSGVEWIGKVAVENNIEKLKFLLIAPMQYGANESGINDSAEGIRYIRITDIADDNTLKNSEDNMYLPRLLAESYLLHDQDVLFARSGGTVGKTFIYDKKYGQSAFAGYLIKAECNKEKLLPYFLAYYTQSSIYNLWKNSIFIQATIQNIGATKYSNMEVVIPPIENQKQIIDYLDDKCAKIDKLIAIKQAKIDKLQEYKKSLIYEYVTGKKEVM